jgi:hypothetical protein
LQYKTRNDTIASRMHGSKDTITATMDTNGGKGDEVLLLLQKSYKRWQEIDW